MSEYLLRKHEFEIKETQEQIISALDLQKEVDLKFKTKSAQVTKLQESLEESIHKISSLENEKSQIYLNAATDLEGYLKVMNLQKEIIENQTTISQNSSWRPLTSAVSQLNALVGDYFKKAKGGVNIQSHMEVYLSQLISEIILSNSTNGNSVFEQDSDMPTVRTDVDQLKNVLNPYFLLLSSINEENVKVTAFESGSVCEIKFSGLSDNAIKRLTDIEKRAIVDLDFEEFKIHMAKNCINERGGAVWAQEDAIKKGVLFLRWVL
jgi:hypothetical protein